MEDWIEIEGRSKKDAIERACNALNTNESHLKYEVLHEASGHTKIKAMKLEKGSIEVKEPKQADDEEEFSESEGKTESKVETKEPRGPLVGDGNKAKEILQMVIKFIDDKAEIQLKESDEEIYMDIKGENGGLLIGKYGQTLGALQYLVSRMAGLDRSDTKRLVLDSEQYLARRKESLELLAGRLAEKAVRNGRAIGAEPMNAADRRIMHMALAEDSEVTTKSVGEGLSRRVLIVPKGSEPRRGGGGGPRRNGRRPSGGGSGRFGRGGSNRGPNEIAPRRRAGPKPRMHDSFDAPPEPENDFFEEDPDAPMLDDENTEGETQFSNDDE